MYIAITCLFTRVFVIEREKCAREDFSTHLIVIQRLLYFDFTILQFNEYVHSKQILYLY